MEMLAQKLGVSLTIGFVFLLVAHPAPADRFYTLTADFLDNGDAQLVDVDPGRDQLQLNLTETSLVYINIAATGRGTIVRIDASTGEIIGEYRTAPEGRSASPSRTGVDSIGNLWVANAGEDGSDDELGGSVAKIGIVIGGTRVSLDGEGNLQPDPNGEFLNGPFDYNTCDVRDDGLVRTSRGLDDALPWPANDSGSATGDDTAAGAADDCILVYRRLPGAENARHISVDANDDVWVGGYPGFYFVPLFNSGSPKIFYKLEGNTGAIQNSFDARLIPDVASGNAATGCGGFGGQVDKSGILWSASKDQNRLLYYDPINPFLSRCIEVVLSYGLGIDTNGFVWNSMDVFRSIVKIDPFDLTTVSGFPKTTVPPNTPDKGVAVSPADNHVWVAKGEGTEVLRLDNDGNVIERVGLLGINNEAGFGPTGVAVDARGKIWVTNLFTQNVMRIDPGPVARDAAGNVIQEDGKDVLISASQVDLTIGLLNSAPDNFSNMAAEVTLATTAPEGTWIVTDTGLNEQNEWAAITWNTEPEGNVPLGAAIKVEARAADEEGDLTGKEWVPIVNGDPVPSESLIGQLLQVRATLIANRGGESPILSDLETRSVEIVNVPCFINEDDIIDRLDIDLIVAARNTPANSDDDPRDVDRDGTITLLDARQCVLKCTFPRCSSESVEIK